MASGTVGDFVMHGTRITAAPRPSGYVQHRILAAATAETITAPAFPCIVIFRATADFYADVSTTAAIPAADVTDGTASELNPAQWQVAPGASISVISASACVINAAFYKVV